MNQMSYTILNIEEKINNLVYIYKIASLSKKTNCYYSLITLWKIEPLEQGKKRLSYLR